MNNRKRQLVKAAAAMPMVVTVRAASAQALSSSWACATRDAQAASLEPPVKLVVDSTATTSDDWMRVSGDIWNMKKMPSGTLLKGTGNNILEFYLAPDKNYYELKKVGGQYVVDSTCQMLTPWDLSNKKYVPVSSKKVHLLAYQVNGQVKGWGWQANGGTAITGSCWTSIPTV